MVAQPNHPDEIGERAQRLYEEKIRSIVEPMHSGEYLVLDVEAEDYEVDADRRRALERAEAKHPGGLFYILRIGYPAAVHLGGRFTVNRP
jgi:hypothetical protein